MDKNEAAERYNQKVAALFRREYERRGLTYDEIAERTGLSRMTVVRIINGQRPITVAYLAALSPVLGFDMAKLINEAKS